MKKLILIVFTWTLLLMSHSKFCVAGWDTVYSGAVQLFGVWGSSATDVFVVGGNVIPTGPGVILHYDGVTWSEMWSSETDIFVDVWGSSPTDVFAVGTNLSLESSERGSIIYHYNGSTWAEMEYEIDIPSALLNFSSVWGSSENDVFVAGGGLLVGAVVCHYDGTSLTQIYNGPPWGFRDVWGSSANDVFAVGDDGPILHYNGINWSIMEGYDEEDYYLGGVWGSSPTNVFAVGQRVGESGVIYHYNGSYWSEMCCENIPPLTSVWGSSRSNVFAVGSSETILNYNGLTWSKMMEGREELSGFFDVWCTPSGSDVFVVGCSLPNSGIILHHGGTTETTTTTTGSNTTTTIIDGQNCPLKQIYGEHSEETELLRYIRDNVLSQTPEGQEIIRLYYLWSPAIVKAMEGDEDFREEVKELFDGVLE